MKYGLHVFVLIQRDELCASQIMDKRLKPNPSITCVNCPVCLMALNQGCEDEKELPLNRLFYAIGVLHPYVT